MAWGCVKVIIMKELNVIDLDKTLISYDSFKKYVFFFLKNKNFTLKILLLIILRKIRLLSLASFKRKIIEISRKDEKYDEKMINFSDNLYMGIDDSVTAIIRKYTNKNTINVLCTASPEDYVKKLAMKMGWLYLCTTLNEDDFVHMHGEQKVVSIKSKFPKSQYDYNYAISDSNSDLGLLKLFNDFQLLIKS